MHTLRDLILVAATVWGVAAGIHYWQSSRESLASGSVVDLETRRMVAGVHVLPKYLNGHGGGVATDAGGRFRLRLPHPTETVGLFADGDAYAGLFGKTLGFGGHWLAPGGSETGAVVPAIAAAGISGSVRDEAGNPVPGCTVDLMRPMRLLDPLDLGMSIDETITDTSGTFRFTRLSAGVYYPNADCNAQGNSSYLPEKEVRGTPRPSTAWRRTL